MKEEEDVDAIRGQLDRRQGELGCPAEREQSMSISLMQLLRREVKLSTAAAVAIIATLVFIEGLWALWTMLVGFTQFHFGFQFAIFGLIGGPLLLVGSKFGYWYSLIDMTANAILCFASFTCLVWVVLFKVLSADPAWGPVDLGGPILLLALTVVALWSIRVLRSADVQNKYGFWRAGS